MIQQSEQRSARYRRGRYDQDETSGGISRGDVDDERSYRAAAELLDDPAHPLRAAAYRYPVSRDELRASREGFRSLAGGASVFAGGVADYAHSLLASWYALREHEELAGRLEEDRLADWFAASRLKGAVVTTSLQPVRPIHPSRTADPVAVYAEEGLVLSGAQTFEADALFADELLVLLHEEGGRTPVTIALVPADDPRIVVQTRPELTSFVNVVYEAVQIPWKRVLVDRSEKDVSALLGAPAASAYPAYRWLARQLEELELMAGTLFAVAEKGVLHKQLAAQGELAEAIQGLETVKALLEASELQAVRSASGALVPAPLPLQAAKRAFGPAYRLTLELLNRFSAAWQLDAPAAHAHGTEEDAALLRWVQSLTGSTQAALRSLHVQYAFGDSAEQGTAIYAGYPLEPLKERYRRFWRQHAAE
ncbi:4-hydroxyphenylacetate 3-hydroxylase C-terminal domain-containing protein [Paenibacillus hodogayensis]|uniref:4-hydroxyphenylacetate 3-hydroxylase C-terminal domain-containing protein n=1 Tax=Paenibacillus hodogayensis TaxID=279208 RepID=A0ABV5VRN4_9BACL